MLSYFIILIFISKTIFGSKNNSINEVLSSIDDIKCYYYSINFKNVPDSSETKTECLSGDNCVKVVERSNTRTSIWKGCSSNLVHVLTGLTGNYHIPNICFSGRYIKAGGVTVQQTICGCNNKNYCNSGSKSIFIPIIFINLLLFPFRLLLY